MERSYLQQMNRCTLCMLILFFSHQVLKAQDRPYGLLTDLVSHTDRVYIDGYPSTLRLDQIGDAIEPVQYSEIGSSFPSFSWIIPGTTPGTEQSAYHLILSDSLHLSQQEKGNIWDSGLLESNRSTSVIYAGSPLKPETNYYWRVKVVTNTGGETGWSEVKAFRTGNVLKDYTASYERLVKTPGYPIRITTPAAGVQLADFGKDAFSQLKMTLSSDVDGDSVFIRLGEYLADGRIASPAGSSIRMQDHTVALMKGTHTYRIKIPKDRRNTGKAAIKMEASIGEVLPFRYVEVRNYGKPLAATDLVRESVHVPFDDTAASFRCNNDTLNQIWELCKYSMKATSFSGYYVDGDRERIPYEADVLINQLGHYCADRSYATARRSWEYLLEHPTWPTEWILQALVLAWNDYMYTADARSLQANYEILKKRTLLALQEGNNLISTTTGLQTPAFSKSIRFDGQIRDIVDWPNRPGTFGKDMPGEADGFVFTDYNAVTNAWHYEALRLMEKIASTLGNEADAARFSSACQTVAKAFEQTFYDKKQQLYCDGDTTRHASLHTNMFAVDFGLVPAKRLSRINEFIRSRGMACSVYGSQFLLDALYDLSDGEHALALLTDTSDRSWYNMIRVGSTISLEAWDNKYKPNQDWNHAWGAAPANIIMRRLVGVEPLTPGFETVSIKPQIADLTYVEATVPTIRGEIKVKIENEEHYKFSVSLPANMKADVYLPLKKASSLSGNLKMGKVVKINNIRYLYIPQLASGDWTFEL